MRLPSIAGIVLIGLLVSACAMAATSQAVARPTPGAIVVHPSLSAQPSAMAVPPSPTEQLSATADRTPSAECISPPGDVLTLVYQSDPVACYRSASLTFDAYLTSVEIDGPCRSVEPAWLGDCGSFVALYPVLDRSKFSPSLFAAIDPASGNVDPATGGVLESLFGRNVRVAGHYDDPAAALCHPTGGSSGVRAETPHPGSDWVEGCRATFVLTSIVLLGS